MLREVEILKNIKHPGIIQVFDVIETKSNINIIMEFADGGDLFEQLKEDFKVKKPNQVPRFKNNDQNINRTRC